MKAAVLRARYSNIDVLDETPTAALAELAEVAGLNARVLAVIGRANPRVEKRPTLDRLMADAHKRKFDVVVVARFDRFARSVSHLLRALETFQALGIQFVSLSEQLDTSTPAGKMVFTVLGAVAELERSPIVERVKAGLRNARAKGKRLGRPEKIVDHARIGRLRAQGVSWRKIARQMECSARTARRAGQKATCEGLCPTVDKNPPSQLHAKH